jgi:flagellar hook-length control protein FliK
MIATRTMSVMVTMAILGIVPVAAHAQQLVDLDELVSLTGTTASNSEPAQVQTPEIIDSDTNQNTATNTPINFAIVAVGPFNSGTATSDPTLTTPFQFTASDADSNTIVAEQNQDAPVTQNLGQGVSQEQNPAFPVSSMTDIVADVFPGT